MVVVVFLEGRSWCQAQQLQVALLGLSAAEILEVRGAQRLGIGARLMWGEAAAEQGHAAHTELWWGGRFHLGTPGVLWKLQYP